MKEIIQNDDFFNKVRLLIEEKITVDEFSHWIYSMPDLADTIGGSYYDFLLSFSYWEKNRYEELELFLMNLVKTLNNGEYLNISKIRLMIKVKRVLEEIIKKEIDVFTGCAELRKIRDTDDLNEEVIAIEFIGYDSILDEIPRTSEYANWNEDKLLQYVELSKAYEKDIVEFSRRQLEKLNKTLNN
jgi:hypothetical protein